MVHYTVLEINACPLVLNLLVSPPKELKTSTKPCHKAGYNSPKNQTAAHDLNEMEFAS